MGERVMGEGDGREGREEEGWWEGDGREGREEEGWWERGRGMRTTVA